YDVVDVRLRAGDGCGDLRQHAALVDDLELDADVEELLGVGRPFDVDHLFGIRPRFGDDRAIVSVNHHALALADEADDGIPRDRPAAVRELHGHAFGAADHYRR